MSETRSSIGAVLLAHQGGWDEALLIGGPIVVIVGLLMLAKRRVDAAHVHQTTGQDPNTDRDTGAAGHHDTGPDADEHDQNVDHGSGRRTDG